MSFTFISRLGLGRNGTKSVNELIDALVAALNTQITDGTTASLTDLSVTTDKLAALAVTAAKLGASSVTTAKINAGAVTGAKLDADATTSWFVTGADATSAAQDLAAVGSVAGLRIVEAINWTDGTVLTKSLFTAGTDKFVLASSNLAAKKILIRTLPAAS